MLKRSHTVAVIGVTLVTLLLLLLPAGCSGRVRAAMATTLAPLFGAAGLAQSAGPRATRAIQSRAELVAEIRRLEEENRRLRLEGLQSAQVRRENDELRQLVGWPRQVPWKARLARVVGRDPANWWQAIHVDVGRREGVQTNLPVMTVDGLVGRVAEVGWDRSLVVLVGDPNCRVSASILETRDHGIIGPGSSSTDPQVVHLSYLPNSEQIRPGQWVATSGLGLFPAGIAVGRVMDTRKVGYGLYTEARVKLSVALSRLKEVWIVWP